YAVKIFPRSPVEHIVEAVAVGIHQQLALLAAPGAIDQNRNLAGVPVVHVVRGELEVPLDLACGRVEGKETARVKIVARPHVPVPLGARFPGSPVEEVHPGVVGAGPPRRAGAGLPAVAAPRVMARLAGSGDRPGTPQPLAGLRVVGIEKAADTGLAA